MKIKQVSHKSQEYFSTVELRERLLRTPLGLCFTGAELEQEANEFHIAAFEEDLLFGCLVLVPRGDCSIKMRQLVIDRPYQKRGIGTKLVIFSEEFSKQKGFTEIILHARKTAVSFYKRLGYTVISDEFIEVTIPHYKMRKSLGI